MAAETLRLRSEHALSLRKGDTSRDSDKALG